MDNEAVWLREIIDERKLVIMSSLKTKDEGKLQILPVYSFFLKYISSKIKVEYLSLLSKRFQLNFITFSNRLSIRNIFEKHTHAHTIESYFFFCFYRYEQYTRVSHRIEYSNIHDCRRMFRTNAVAVGTLASDQITAIWKTESKRHVSFKQRRYAGDVNCNENRIVFTIHIFNNLVHIR